MTYSVFLENTHKETTPTLDKEEVVNIEENENAMLVDYELTSFNREERSKKRRVNTDVESIEMLKRKVASTEEHNAGDETEEDKLFLLSMLSHIKKVPAERKLKLRGDIIALVAAAQAPLQQGWTP